MNYLTKKRQFITSKLKFKSKEDIPTAIYKNKKVVNEEKSEDQEIQSNLPLQEENQEKKIFKEFISEKDLKSGLNPNTQKSYSKLSKIAPLPKEYKVYHKSKKTEYEKKHLKKVEKEKNKLTISQKIEQWNFNENYEKYQKLLTSLPEFNELQRISNFK